MLQRIFSLNKEHFLRGLSPSEYYDGGKVLYSAVGIDLFRTPGRLRAGFDVEIIGTPTVQGSIRAFVNHPYSIYEKYIYGYDEGGKVYQITDADAFSIVHSVSNPARGLTNYYSDAGIPILIYTQKKQVGLASYATMTFLDTAVGGPDSLEDYTPHPVKVGVDNNLYIGNKFKLAKWDATTLTANRLTFESDFRVDALESDGFYLVIGGRRGYSRSARSAYIYFWDMVSNQVSRTYLLPGQVTVNRLLYHEGYIYAFCDYAVFKCSFDSPPVEVIRLEDRFRGMSSADVFRNTIVFGAGSSTVSTGAIGRLGNTEPDLPHILQTPWKVTDTDKAGIKCIFTNYNEPGQLLITTNADKCVYRVTTTSLTGVSAKSPFIDLGRYWKLHFLKVTTETLASGDSLTVSLKTKSGGSEILKTTTFTFAADGAKTSKLFPIDGTITDQVQYQITFTAGNVQVKSIELFGEPQEELMTN